MVPAAQSAEQPQERETCDATKLLSCQQSVQVARQRLANMWGKRLIPAKVHLPTEGPSALPSILKLL